MRLVRGAKTFWSAIINYTLFKAKRKNFSTMVVPAGFQKNIRLLIL